LESLSEKTIVVDIELVVTTPPGHVRIYPVTKDQLTIGRATTNDVVLPDLGVSRAHARLHRVGKAFEIEDLGSTNGTWLNDQSIMRAPLQIGQTIRVADCTLRLQEATPPAPNEPNLDAVYELTAFLAPSMQEMDLPDLSKPRLLIQTRWRTWDIALTAEVTTIGRQSDCQVFLQDARVSRQHAQIIREAYAFVLVDLASHSGTWLGNQRIERHTLRPGDYFRIGGATLVFNAPQKSPQFKLIIDHMADGVFSTDADGRILAFNPAAEKITGCSASEMLGRQCGDKFGGQNENNDILCGSRDCPVRKILGSASGIRPMECKEWITRQDGERRPVVHSIAPIVDQTARIIGTVSILRDVSREEESLRLKSEFISLVSHQLRTPLANINASAELLTNSNLDETLRKDLVQNLFQQSERLCRLVNQVLESARLEKGKLQVILEPLALLPLIEQTTAMFQQRIGAHVLRIDVAPDLTFPMGDRTSVEIILENLIQNALNYSPQGSTITISAEECDDAVVVSVADQGIGIPVDQLHKVFQPFYRISNRNNTQSSGFGLGLYIARMLVEAQGGTIWAESESGQGACFRFTLQKLEE
jgi:PAS domain S-box-containing protein